MEYLHKLISIIRDPGPLMVHGYWVLVLIVFLETGALVFFLPGDSLLFTAGLYCANTDHMNIVVLNALLIPAAIIGDATSYQIGKRLGPALFKRKESRLFKPAYVKAAHDFYEKHGGKAIIIARFMPLVRTFVPVVAGVGGMSYRRFALFNVIGAAAWVLSMTLAGFILGKKVPWIGKRIEIVILVIVFLSITPGIYAWIQSRRKGKTLKQEVESELDKLPSEKKE